MALLERLAEAVARALPKPIDPAVFGDPLALQTQWTPLVRGGSNFGTHRLVEGEAGCLEFKQSLGALAFGGVFMAVGLGAGGSAALNGSPWFALFALPFTAVGVLMVWPAPLRFDPATRQYVSRKVQVPFSRIRALQLLPERVSSDGGSFKSYELNLVLEDGKRLNVVDHGNLATLREDSARVAALLGCPLWDAVGL